MISFLCSLMAVIKDVKDEIRNNSSKFIFVSSKKDLLTKLNKLKVNPSEVRFYDTKEKVKDWDNVGGVFKKDDNIYAYSNLIQSELDANLNSL